MKNKIIFNSFIILSSYLKKYIFFLGLQFLIKKLPGLGLGLGGEQVNNLLITNCTP